MCRNSSFTFWLGVTTHPSTGWMIGWTDGLHILGRVIAKRAFVKYDSSIVAQMHDSVFCAYLCSAGWSGWMMGMPAVITIKASEERKR